MAQVTGIGGVFFKAKGDPKILTDWYQEHLGIKLNPYGSAVFHWAEDKGVNEAATAWSIDDKNSKRYAGCEASFIINYRVDDLVVMVANLKKSGVKILKDVEASEYGKFASIVDPEGNRIELWQQ